MKDVGELYAIQVESLRKGLIQEIRFLLEQNNLTEIEIPQSIGDTIFVIWFDKSGYPYECRVVKVIMNKGYITVVATDTQSGDKYMMDSRYHLGARNPDWLCEIYSNVLKTIRRKER